jgi:hypothetical protein
MRKALILAPAMLCACATVPAQTSVHGTVPGHICNADRTARFIGQRATAESGGEIMRATNSAILRWAPPGYMLSMDYSASRVTIHLDPAQTITAINCG